MGKPIFKWLIIALTAVVLVAAGAPTYYYLHKHGGIKTNTGPAQMLEKVKTVDKPGDTYDVVVVGTDPEGITAAVSASRNGLKTLLVDANNREILGGLFTVGELVMIDLNQDKDKPYSKMTGLKPSVLNKGLFSEWFDKVEGTTFDVHTGANAFNEMVKKEKNIDVLLKAKTIEPITVVPAVKNADATAAVQGVRIVLADGSKHEVKAKAVIDATQDANIAAAAGAPFTVGREDIGDSKSRMAVTPVFRIKNVSADVWQKVVKRLVEDGDYDTDADDHSAWGYGKMSGYLPLHPDKIKMRGLNIGRQNDNTALINALQIFDVDPFDPKSRQDAMKLANEELPRVVDYMKQIYPEFGPVEFDGIAPELYVRETRHMQGLYRLNIVDVLDNRDQWDRIAFGSYRVDLQRTSPQDNGMEILAPYKYAVPFRSIVPQKVDGLLVVGRSASYDTLAHGSARVVPTGMAEGEAAGAAAKLAIDSKLTFRELSANKQQVAKLQDMLNKQGMDLKPFKVDPSSKEYAYLTHKQYAGLKYAVYVNIVGAGGSNDFKLDEPSNPQRVVNNLGKIRKIYTQNGSFKGDPSAAVAGIGAPDKQSLTLDQASFSFAKLLGLSVAREQAQKELESRGLLTKASLDTIADKQKLTNGDVYMMVKDFLEGSVRLTLQ